MLTSATPRATPSTPARRQRGLTLFGLLVWAIFIGFLGLMAIRVWPSLNEYTTIQQSLTRIMKADPADWLTYHGSFKSWHYSALDQINTKNVKGLKEAWSHSPSRATRGLQSFPLAADGQYRARLEHAQKMRLQLDRHFGELV